MTLEGAIRARATAESVARHSYGKLVAFLAARSRDVAAAEDALSEAFAAALQKWPQEGVPDKPEAWLLVVARRRLIDAHRRRQHGQHVLDQLGLLFDPMAEDAGPRPIPDERLALMFVCAHPAIDRSVRAPLMLQTILGFDAATIAQAFLVPAATMSQRLVRAKNKIRQAGIAFRIPQRSEWVGRLGDVLDALYANFTEGWSCPTMDDPRRQNLAEEGIWLARLIASLLPDEPEVLGLLALMLHAAARRNARRDAQGDYVPLELQDCRLWDEEAIQEAESHLLQASRLQAPGRFQLEAAVQSVHAARRLTGRTDWPALALLYDALLAISGSPVVAMNRAVAKARVAGAEVGLAELDELKHDSRLQHYQPYWAARAELLAGAGHLSEARAAFSKAIELEEDLAVRRFLLGRAARLCDADGSA
jgi:RNA polymerase sigma-70 factor (ECF subfamily)